MPKVAIVSMQRIFNYGSTLQAYALRRLVEESIPGACTAFVDYRPGTPLVEAEHTDPARGRLGRATAKLREYGKANTPLLDKLRFFNHKRKYAARYFPIVGIPDDPNFDLNVDLEIIGSDEVFNCVQTNTNVGYSPDLFGHASPAKRIVSYAASFGNTTIDKIDSAGIRSQLVIDFQRFARISVRDLNSARIIEALTGNTPEIHLDPTLVYPLLNDPRVPRERPHPGKYVVVYGYSGRFSDDENQAIRAYAESIDARVLTFGGLQECEDDFIDCDPFRLLAYFRDAEAIVTDTFHGTIFAVINERPFATLIRRSSGHGYGNEEKLGYLLETLGLSNHALAQPGGLAATLETPIDYATVSAIRALEGERTRYYLARAAVSL